MSEGEAFIDADLWQLARLERILDSIPPNAVDVIMEWVDGYTTWPSIEENLAVLEGSAA